MKYQTTRNLKRRNKFVKIALLAGVLLLVLFSAVFAYKKYFFREAVIDVKKATLPSPVDSREVEVGSKVSERQTSNSQPPTDSIPAGLNLPVPFTSQAPQANWDFTHEEACEEAAILMTNRYFQGRKIAGAEDAERGLQEIIAWEKENLNGVWESTTAKESAKILTDMLGLKAQLVYDPNIEQIKQAIAEDKLVIVPSAGRELENPFYKSPGPLYHFLLIKGYTALQFITNDAGTRRGENYPYNFETLLSANHDWNGGNVTSGRKVMILVSK